MHIKIEKKLDSDESDKRRQIITDYIDFNFKKIRRFVNDFIISIGLLIGFIIISYFYQIYSFEKYFISFLVILPMLSYKIYQIYKLKKETKILQVNEIKSHKNVEMTTTTINDIGIEINDNTSNFLLKWNHFRYYDTFETFIIFYPKKIEYAPIIVNCEDIEDNKMLEFEQFVESALKRK